MEEAKTAVMGLQDGARKSRIKRTEPMDRMCRTHTALTTCGRNTVPNLSYGARSASASYRRPQSG